MEALTARSRATFRMLSPVRSVKRSIKEGLVRHDAGIDSFDQVIFACHSDRALAILGGEASALGREILGHFPYQSNDTVLMGVDLHRSAAITFNMNLLQSLRSPHTFCVSLNEQGIDPSKVIRRFTYHHPVFLPGRQAMQARHAELIGPNRTSFCGADWGFGFHEDGVKSALAVCRSFGQDLA